jgi:ribosomal protein S18 acetylase RimI-like enzyme
MIIRSLVFQDKPKILTLLQQRGVFNNDEIKVAMGILDLYLNDPEQKDYNIFCAADNGDGLAGYICFGPIPMTEGCYDLYWIAVDQNSGRKGIGEKLLASMEEFVGKKKGRCIYLDTSSTPPYNPAKLFYKKHGFKTVSVLRDFYRVGDHKMILMKKVA